MINPQVRLPLETTPSTPDEKTYRDKVITALRDDLDFHAADSRYASHNFHSFPAKFPPQLPRAFISKLTRPGDIVLDPMMGSGTTVLEAFLAKRQAIGFDIDPLALLISKVKVTPLDPVAVIQTGTALVNEARSFLASKPDVVQHQLLTRWDDKSRQFVDYWFRPETQLELLALLSQIEQLSDPLLKSFFEVAFSAIIITKSGGVSLALDLGHTRPHRAKYVIKMLTTTLRDDMSSDPSVSSMEHNTKTIRSPFDEFLKRVRNNTKGLCTTTEEIPSPKIASGNAESLPLEDSSVDLIVTSPPYASNAIDYMRAHKFSLVWMGYPIDTLGDFRKRYIGGEATDVVPLEPLPEVTQKVVHEIASVDDKRGRVLHRYYSEMTRVFREMHRVLKPGKVAIVVVGNSVMRGKDTQTQSCLADIGASIGFDVPGIGVRKIDRNRRMLPTTTIVQHDSQIEQRMHEEYVIALLKPDSIT